MALERPIEADFYDSYFAIGQPDGRGRGHLYGRTVDYHGKRSYYGFDCAGDMARLPAIREVELVPGCIGPRNYYR